METRARRIAFILPALHYALKALRGARSGKRQHMIDMITSEQWCSELEVESSKRTSKSFHLFERSFEFGFLLCGRRDKWSR